MTHEVARACGVVWYGVTSRLACRGGSYDVVCNLGALAARFVFKPIEENYYVFFAKIIAREGEEHETQAAGKEEEQQQQQEAGGEDGDRSHNSSNGGSNSGNSGSSTKHPTTTTTTTTEDLQLAGSTLSTLLWFVGLVGLTVLTYGQAYSRALLHLYGGATLSEGPGPSLLRTYCAYVLALAVNGITECFVFATAPTAYLSFFNHVMVRLFVRLWWWRLF